MIKQIIFKTICAIALFAAGSVHAQNYSKVTYIHSDADGTVFAATDSQGDLDWQIDHYPYGNEFENTQIGRKSDISFAGKPFDEEIGLSYFGARWYDPDIGRFTGIDPAPVNANDYRTFNRYAYGNNNPYKYVDPDGRLPILIPVAIWAAKALAVAGAGISGYSVGNNGYAVYSGRKSAGEAATDAAVGVGAGLLLKGAGAGVLKMVTKGARMPTGNSQLKHIFDSKKVNDGHIAPKTNASQERAGKMFENITTNPSNKRPDLVTNPHQQEAGIEIFTKNQIMDKSGFKVEMELFRTQV